NDGMAAEYEAFRTIAQGLTPPLLAIPGNHDDRAAFRAGVGLMLAVAPQDPAPEAPCDWQAQIGGLTLFGLDTSVPHAPHGALAPAQLAWLDGALGAGSGPVIVFTHHPPFDTGITHMDRSRLGEGEALLTLLARHERVQLVASGHVHRLIEARCRPPAVIAPAPAHAVWLETARDGPPAYAFEPGAVLLHRWDAARAMLVTQLSPIAVPDGPHLFPLPPPPGGIPPG
ncbi:MAG: metallophosphoesterase, partial [Pseudomonadota bacterium]